MKTKGAAKKFYPHWDINGCKWQTECRSKTRASCCCPRWLPVKIFTWMTPLLRLNIGSEFPSESASCLHYHLPSAPCSNKLKQDSLPNYNYKPGRKIREAMFPDSLKIPLCWTEPLKSLRLGPHNVRTTQPVYSFIHPAWWKCEGTGKGCKLS